MSSNMYREMILDLYENPLNHGELDPHTFSHEEDNPLCGDVVRIDVVLDDDQRIKEIAWSGDGCAISMASADILCDIITNIKNPIMVIDNFISMINGDDMTFDEELKVLEVFKELQEFPARKNCAILPWKTLKSIL